MSVVMTLLGVMTSVVLFALMLFGPETTAAADDPMAEGRVALLDLATALDRFGRPNAPAHAAVIVVSRALIAAAAPELTCREFAERLRAARVEIDSLQ